MNSIYRLYFILFVLVLISCKKDCLKKGDCELSTYQSAYLQEQTLPPATGTVYYIDAEAGKKNNSGTAETDAFKTVEQLEDVTLSPGDQILFKRGQIHYGELEIKQSGNSSNPIYISAYGSGDLPVFKSEDGSPDKSDKITLFLNKANYIVIQNLNIQGGRHAIMVSNSDYCVVAGCRIGEQSNSGLRATAEYSQGDGSDFGEVHHCLIYSGLSGDFGDLQSTDGIQLMDGASNWHIHNNEFKAWAHSAMAIKQIYNLEENNNNLVEENLFECGDIDYMRAFDCTGGDQLVANNVFIKNIIRNQTVTSHIHGNSNTAAYNMFLGVKLSSASSQPYAMDLHVFNNQIGGEERKKLVCYDNAIYNNLIYNYNDGVGIKLINSMSGSENIVHDNYIANNLFFNVGNPIDIDAEPTNISIENNLSFNNGGAILYVSNFAAYNLNDFEAINSNGWIIQNNIEGNPSFTNISTEDFSLQSGSIAIDAGKVVGLTEDFFGNPINGNPDIGVVEF